MGVLYVHRDADVREFGEKLPLSVVVRQLAGRGVEWKLLTDSWLREIDQLIRTRQKA
jgi:hypothetical protein